MHEELEREVARWVEDRAEREAGALQEGSSDEEGDAEQLEGEGEEEGCEGGEDLLLALAAGAEEMVTPAGLSQRFGTPRSSQRTAHRVRWGGAGLAGVWGSGA